MSDGLIILIAAILIFGGAFGFAYYGKLRNKARKKYDPGGPVTDGTLPAHWTLGPIVWGKNRTVGMPLHPSPEPGALFAFEFPTKGSHVHYVTFRHGSLAGKSRIRMRYKIDADPGVQIVPQTDPALPSLLTLYFNQFGDSWTGTGEFETYRWYASFATVMGIVPGEHELVASLDANWTAVATSTAFGNLEVFTAAKQNADHVGFVLGGGDGLGHGVYATGWAKMTVVEFVVE